jgi:predicted N-acyltransferase
MIHNATATSPSRREDGAVDRLDETETGLEVLVVETIRAVDRSRWNDVVERSELGTVFHRYEWLEAIETALGYEPRHFVVEKDTNPIGVFPNFVVDLPKTPFSRLTSLYPGFGGPLLTTDVEESLSLLIDAATKYCNGRTLVHEIRVCNTNFLRYDDFLQSHGYRSDQTGGRFLLNLAKGYDQLFEGMSSSKQRAIRRGRETDHEVVEEELTEAALGQFHELYERHMNSIDGKVYPLSFFERLAEMESRILLVTLRIDGEYAGGFLELLNDEQCTVHGFFTGVPEEYFEYYASETLYDYVFQWAIDNGYETYDFGGSGHDFRAGAFTFKEEFGGQLVPNLRWECGANPAWNLVKTGRSLYRRYG